MQFSNLNPLYKYAEYFVLLTKDFEKLGWKLFIIKFFITVETHKSVSRTKICKENT